MHSIYDYEKFVGKSSIEELKLLADKLNGKIVQHINSTAVGGGVAEILNRMIPLMKELGIDARWDFIKGGEKFFQVTKKFHNALHGQNINIEKDDIDVFLNTTEENLNHINLNGDIIFIHDPQPAALIKKKNELNAKWIWRCHIDLSNPHHELWKFLKGFVEKYDACVFSAPSFSQKLKIRQFLISPSIDPLSDKNKELPQEYIDSVLDKYGIDKKIPIVIQVSRFDYLKDPVGVIDAFRMVRKSIKCQLILVGGTASDDPESDQVLAEVREKANKESDILILAIPPDSDLEINALQRAATVIMQKSLKEGFGLTVAESLWKGKAMVASGVGGIPLQIKHKFNGMLCHSIEGAAHFVKQLLNNPEYAKKLGENGKEHIRNNFLLTRHIKDYLLTFIAVLQAEKDVINL